MNRTKETRKEKISWGPGDLAWRKVYPVLSLQRFYGLKKERSNSEEKWS
jgi:hypothetical protein